MPVEPDLFRRTHEKLDCVLVVQDHLRFELFLAFGHCTEVNQPLCIEQRVGVPLQTAGIP